MTLKIRNIGFLLVLFCITENSSCQFISLNNHSGYWTDTTSWVDNEYPGTSVKKYDIDCFGWITSLNCIDINLGIVTIRDTLIINGNLELLNKAELIVDSSAILMVFGDIEINNQAIVHNSGTMIVAGNFRIVGSANVGSFSTSQGALFLFDNTPEFPQGENYSDLVCSDPTEYRNLCGYGNYDDLKKSDLFAFYNLVPFSKRILDTLENSCFTYDILKNNNEICIDGEIVYELVTTGINPSDSIAWYFGNDAFPQTATGFGPHKVKYNKAGKMDVQINVISDSVMSLEENMLITVQENPVTGHLIADSNPDMQLYPYLDEVCRNEIRIYSVDSNFQSTYSWVIPSVNFDTMNGHYIAVNWDVPSGEYGIMVQERTSAGCLGTATTGIVKVNECEGDKPDQVQYTISPNGDGINDAWVIENIESYPEAQIIVLQRDGRIVFKSDHDYFNNWDGSYNGRKLPLDSYYYIIDLSKYNKGVVKGIITIIPLELK